MPGVRFRKCLVCLLREKKPEMYISNLDTKAKSFRGKVLHLPQLEIWWGICTSL